MSEIDDGGSAFPSTKFKAVIPDSFSEQQKLHMATFINSIPTNGMSLRDWFAGQTISRASDEYYTDEELEQIAKNAYRIADAMIAERNKK